MKILSLVLPILALALFSFKGTNSEAVVCKTEAPLSLYDSIVMMDTRWEKAYNNCLLDEMEELISEDLEFYHDRGGLLTSKKKLNEAVKNNICGKVKRILKEGSIEVYEIPGFGAIEMGLHGFTNINQQTVDHYSKFVHIWKREKGHWRITRVISLH
jgi:hypothetical protein